MDFDIVNDLQATLIKEEKLLWTGRPKAGIKFRSSDLLMIPFSLMWGGFAIFWESMVLSNFNAPFIMKLWGIPFVLIGLYMIFGRFFVDALQRKNTVYGITNNRVIVKSGIISKTVKSLNIHNMADITLKEKTDGSGTILLVPTDSRQSMLGGSSWPGAKQAPTLEFIDDAKNVYNILIEQQKTT
jgi:hypothetical protein